MSLILLWEKTYFFKNFEHFFAVLDKSNNGAIDSKTLRLSII